MLNRRSENRKQGAHSVRHAGIQHKDKIWKDMKREKYVWEKGMVLAEDVM